MVKHEPELHTRNPMARVMADRWRAVTQKHGALRSAVTEPSSPSRTPESGASASARQRSLARPGRGPSVHFARDRDGSPIRLAATSAAPVAPTARALLPAAMSNAQMRVQGTRGAGR
jgi:hypothetical protein